MILTHEYFRHFSKKEYVFLMPNPRTLNVFGPRIMRIDAKMVTYFIFLHNFGRPHNRIIRICNYEKISRMSVCLSVVLSCTIRGVICEVRKGEGEGAIRCWY